MQTKRFQDLVAWQKAHAFVLAVYQLSGHFPAHERFGLCSQFQRAAVSIPANIAEGYRKLGIADKLRFLNIAQGSLEENAGTTFFCQKTWATSTATRTKQWLYR